jgi:hypothetical protein
MAEYEYQHSVSFSKPTSESHSWSFHQACVATQAEIENRHGVDWKITSIKFEDKGRQTKDETDWTGKRSWRCTHTVIARYAAVHRGHGFVDPNDTSNPFIETDIQVSYKMINVNHPNAM